MPDTSCLTAIGTMAGTSLDGVDLAILRTDGEGEATFGPTLHVPYEGATRAKIIQATQAALEGRDFANDIEDAHHLVTGAHLEAIRALLRRERLTPADIDVIGFHGQTILHRSPTNGQGPGRTWQIGSGRDLADELKIDTVDDFRTADVQAGGEGAPLAPVWHRTLAGTARPGAPLAVLNLGGVANYTFVPANGALRGLTAFDCGPGNGLIDQWVQLKTGARMDEDGKLATAGKVDDEALRLMALSPYLRRRPPKSLDRYDFKLDRIAHLSVEDGAATLTAFTAVCCAQSLSLMPERPEAIVVCGGGRHNPVMMEALRAGIEVDVQTAEDVGWRGDFIEAEAFAFLAVRSVRGLPISFPDTTRAPHPLTGGTLHRA